MDSEILSFSRSRFFLSSDLFYKNKWSQNQMSNITFYRARTRATFIMTHTLQSSEQIQVFGCGWSFGCQRRKWFL